MQMTGRGHGEGPKALELVSGPSPFTHICSQGSLLIINTWLLFSPDSLLRDTRT